LRTEKVLTTAGAPADGVLAALERAVADPGDVVFLVHGTTVGLNALLERRGAEVALVTTQGFRDLYVMGTGERHDLFTLKYRKPEPLLRNRDVLTVPERVRADGSVALPLDPAGVDALVERLGTLDRG